MTTTAHPPTTPRPDRPHRAWRRPVLHVVAAICIAGGSALLAGCSDATATDEAGDDRPAAESAESAELEVPAPEVLVDGIDDGALLSAAGVAEAVVRVATSSDWAETLEVLLDGLPVVAVDGAAELTGDQLAMLGDGEHVLEAVVGDDTAGVATSTITFVLDTTPPSVELPDLVETRGYHTPVEIEIGVDGATSVAADGGEAALHDDGRATVSYDTAPPAVSVTATDDAGNATTAEVPVVVHFPGGRAVHTTPSAWRYEPKRTPVIELLEAGLIDAVQMDIKDELGDVGWDTDVELADLAGAEDFNRNFDMAAAIEEIHSHGARVIGRLVVYRDTRLAKWAWNNGRQDMVLQATDGSPYEGRYGDYAFTNFANPDVQQYNLDIALEAAELGFDDVLYDYIRRPDGAIEKLVIPGLGDRTPEEAVVEVMATAYPLLRDQGVWVGASVFGIAIDRPKQMAQDIPLMAEHVDYIAPMVYPNHWNLGEYDVPVPEEAPYDIVERSLTLYRDALEPTGTALMPWLQDFGGYGEAEVRAQIDATEAVTGERSFLLWASSATYTHAALDPIPDQPEQ